VFPARCELNSYIVFRTKTFSPQKVKHLEIIHTEFEGQKGKRIQVPVNQPDNIRS
jgi:hypothetical protein